jgi:hypothetical protein
MSNIINSMGFLDKILKVSEKQGKIRFDNSIYDVLFNRIEYSIKTSNPNLSQNELISKTKDIYLEMCKCMGCVSLSGIYKPIDDALSKCYTAKNDLDAKYIQQ